ncbi:MAG TPA: hypothetical protein DCL48_15640 [Alphaproteobacteria bacterium]|nr:hypothetical protein [Alphaproteobacteria bacterium]
MADQLAFDLTAKVAGNYKAEGTSQRAAAYAARYANGAFGKIRTALLYGPATPDEIAERTGINLLTVRPRTSDLRNPVDADGRPIAPFVVPTGQVRPTAAGRDADVLRLTTPTERRNWKP